MKLRFAPGTEEEGAGGGAEEAICFHNGVWEAEGSDVPPPPVWGTEDGIVAIPSDRGSWLIWLGPSRN